MFTWDPTWTVPVLTFVSVVSLGAAVVVGRAARRRIVHGRLLQHDTATSSSSQSEDGPLLGMLQHFGRMVAPGGASQRLNQKLARAGYFAHSAPAVFLGLKFSGFVLGAVGVGVLVLPMDMSISYKMLLTVGGAAAISFLPDLYVARKRRFRATQVSNHLPDAVDLLEVCVSAGMGLDMAWNAVTDEIRHVSPVLADEMSLANLESHLGASRAVAMRHMAERTGAKELSSLAALLTQSTRFGTSISDALGVFASSMRESRRQHGEEAAEKMAVKMLFPLVVFIFPPIITVCVGPAGIRIAELFSEGA